MDDPDTSLLHTFLKETNVILNKVTSEIQAISRENNVMTASDLSYMSVFDALLLERAMQTIREAVNTVLYAEGKPAVDVQLKGIIILRVLAASCGSSASTITAEHNKEFYFQIGVSSARYSEVWNVFSCSKEKSHRVQHHETGCTNRPTEGNAIITDLENNPSGVNRKLLNVPGATNFSLDDDHQRLRSRAVTNLTNINQINNPKKALGPVNKGYVFRSYVCFSYQSLLSTIRTGHCGEMLRHRSMVKLFAQCSGVNPCMMMHGCTVDLSTCTR